MYVRNYNKLRKFDPIFIDTPFEIIDIDENYCKFRVKHLYSDQVLLRHPDDLKPCLKYYNHVDDNTGRRSVQDYQAPPILYEDEAYGPESYFDTEFIYNEAPQNEQDDNRDVVENEVNPIPQRQSTREHRPNPRYFNNDFV